MGAKGRSVAPLALCCDTRSSGVSSAEVYRYRKGNSQVTSLGTLGVGIIGAGVAACP
ncbi:MAG TPA: hypothetical protein VIM14_00910 [Polyangia bacterium]